MCALTVAGRSFDRRLFQEVRLALWECFFGVRILLQASHQVVGGCEQV